MPRLAALTNAAERQNWIKRYGIDKTYSDMPHERQIEEAIAHRFADPSPRSPPVERAMRAVQAFMERVRNALAGRGFQTADDVFGRVRRGEMGAREPGSGAEQRGPRTVGESQARMEKWHEGEPQFAKLPASAKKPLPLKPDPAWKRAVDEIRTVLSPTSRGSDAKRQEYAHREFGARLAQASQIAAHRLEDARRLVSRYSPDEQDEQNHKLETGQSLGDPKLDAAAKALREAQAEWLQKLQSLGYLKDTIDNYMGHIYSNYREWKGSVGYKIAAFFGLLPSSQLAAQSDVTGATSTLAGDITGATSTLAGDIAAIPTVTPPTAGAIATAINVPGALATYGAAKTTDVSGAEGTLASAIAAIPTTGGGGGGGGLTSDQMTALENAETAITMLNAKIAANMPQIIVVAPVGADGSTLNLIKGDTYDAAGIDGRAISIIVPLAGEPTGLATATFSIVLPGQLAPITLPAPVIDSVGQTATFTFGLTATVTSSLFGGEYNILATFAGGSITSVIHEGSLNVN